MKRFLTLFSFLLISSLTVTASAETVTLIANHEYGQSWVTASSWSDSLAAHSGADYVISGKVMRTPDDMTVTNKYTFPGDSLLVQNSGTISLKSSTTFNDLTFAGGSVSLSSLANFDLAGNINVTGSATFYSIEKDGRSFSISAKLSGPDTATITYNTSKSSNSKIWVTNSANDFSGTVNLIASSNVYLYKGTATGTLGSDSVKLTLNSGSKLHINGNLTVGQWTNSPYYSAKTQSLSSVMPSKITVSDAYVQAALNIAGIDAQVGNVITSTTSTRTAAVYYQNGQGDENESWDKSGIWLVGSKTGTASTYVPTVGDEAHLTTTMRTSSQNDVAGVTEYFLAKLYVDSGSNIGLKNANATVCIPNIILNGGSIGNGKWSGATTKLDGHITVTADSTLQAQADRSVNFLAGFSGDKKLTIGIDNSTYAATQSTVIFNGDNSGFTGSIYAQKYTWITANTQNALGTIVELNADNQLTVNAAQSLSKLRIYGNATINGTNKISTSLLNVNTGKVYKVDDYKSTITFANGFNADELMMTSAKVQVTGGTVTIGKSDRTTSLWVPRVIENYSATDGNVASTSYKAGLDLSGATSATIQVKYFEICATASNFQAIPVADVELAPTTTVTADSLTIASSANTGLGVDKYVNTLTLGSKETTLAIDSIYVGGGVYHLENGTAKGGTKGRGELHANGGKVTITGTDGKSAANMYIGDAQTSTGGGSIGIVDLSGISDDSTIKLNNLCIGRNIGSATYSKGTFTMNSGTVEAENISLATFTGTKTASNYTVSGTLNLNGGTLKAKNVTQGTNTGTETVNFNFTGGTLDVENWGTASIPLNLTQKGGVLTTSAEKMTINGNYTQEGGSLRLDLGSSLTVTEGLALSNIEINSDDASLFKTDEVYPILYGPSVSTLDWTGISVTGLGELASQSLSGMVQNGVFYFGTSSTIASHVPEPATWVLLMLGVGVLRIRGRR